MEMWPEGNSKFGNRKDFWGRKYYLKQREESNLNKGWSK